MKGQVPGSKPGILPFVGHRNDIVVVKMCPITVASIFSLRWWRRLRRIALQPLCDIVEKILFTPQHTGYGLPLNFFVISVLDARLHVAEEFIGLLFALFENRIKILKG